MKVIERLQHSTIALLFLFKYERKKEKTSLGIIIEFMRIRMSALFIFFLPSLINLFRFAVVRLRSLTKYAEPIAKYASAQWIYNWLQVSLMERYMYRWVFECSLYACACIWNGAVVANDRITDKIEYNYQYIFLFYQHIVIIFRFFGSSAPHTSHPVSSQSIHLFD